MNAPDKQTATTSRPIAVVAERKTAEALGSDAVDADAFLAASPPTRGRPRTVYNLCRSLRYRSTGYYVSLVAEARGHPVLPTVATLGLLGDLPSLFQTMEEGGVPCIPPARMTARRRAHSGQGKKRGIYYVQEDEGALREAREDETTSIDVILGETAQKPFRRLAASIHRAVPCPLLRVYLVLESETWHVVEVETLGASALDEAGSRLLAEALAEPPSRQRAPTERPMVLGILYDERDDFAPSTTETIERIARIGAKRGVQVTRMLLDEPERVAHCDALFLRVLTGPRTPAYRFAMRAEAQGIPVIDDTQSIFRCSNKVFLYELLKRESLPMPPTELASAHTPYAQLAKALGVPFVVKVPDGSFSTGVHKIDSEAAYRAKTVGLFEQSPLLVIQGFLPTPFDWRVTILGGRPLFVCRYHMVEGHWQIRAEGRMGTRFGRVEALPRRTAPRDVVRLAVEACALIGEGLYGVDIKPTPAGPVVIEINDNPNIDIGYDDAADGNLIYEDLIDHFKMLVERGEEKPRANHTKEKQRTARLEPFQRPIGPRRRPALRDTYRPFEVCGLELEYAIVDRDLNVLSKVESLLAAVAGHGASDVDWGTVSVSNEIFDHVLEIKTNVPPRSLVDAETWLAEGVARLSALLHRRFDARLLPTGMHPWMQPAKAQLWTRSNTPIYETYARLFDVQTHGWSNVQAVHVNLPLGSEAEAVALMNACALWVPYLPAVAASSPIHDGEIQSAVDGRMAHVLRHQQRLPESCGEIVPEYMTSYRQYRKDVFQPMFAAADRLPDAKAIRHEFLNARGAVIKFSRKSLEVRVIDVQECVKMDVAISAFTRAVLKAMATRLQKGTLEKPVHALLVADLHATVLEGTAAEVYAPHLRADPRDDRVRIPIREALDVALAWARQTIGKEEAPYLDLVAPIWVRGNLSERIVETLWPYIQDEDAFTDATRRLYVELSECLRENRPWAGR